MTARSFVTADGDPVLLANGISLIKNSTTNKYEILVTAISTDFSYVTNKSNFALLTRNWTNIDDLSFTNVTPYTYDKPFMYSTDSGVTFNTKSRNGKLVAIRNNVGTFEFNRVVGIADKYFCLQKPLAVEASIPLFSFNASSGSVYNYQNYKNTQFLNNGTKMYCFIGGSPYNSSGTTYADYILEYTLSVPYNINTASYVNKLHLTDATYTCGMGLSADGSKLIIHNTNDRRLRMYTLSIPYSITSATLSSTSTNTYMTTFKDIRIDATGTNIYCISGNTAYKIPLSVANDVTAAGTTTTTASANWFSNDGTKAVSYTTLANSVVRFDVYEALSVPFSISGETPDTYYNNSGLWSGVSYVFADNGSYMYVERQVHGGNDSKKFYTIDSVSLVGKATIADDNFVPASDNSLSSAVNDFYTQIHDGLDLLSPEEYIQGDLSDYLDIIVPTNNAIIGNALTDMKVQYDSYSKFQLADPTTDYTYWVSGSNNASSNEVFIKANSANNLKIKVI